jgi:hypothetical protein
MVFGDGIHDLNRFIPLSDYIGANLGVRAFYLKIYRFP